MAHLATVCALSRSTAGQLFHRLCRDGSTFFGLLSKLFLLLSSLSSSLVLLESFELLFDSTHNVRRAREVLGFVTYLILRSLSLSALPVGMDE